MVVPLTTTSPPLIAVGRLLSSVAVVIWFADESWAVLPVTDALTKGCAGVPATTGLLTPKSAWLSPPAAVIVPAVAFGLATVTGTVGRLAAYWMAVVACAGTKLLSNCRTVGTLPVGLP